MITLRTSPRSTRGLIQSTASGVRRHRGVDEQPFEGVVEIPVVVQVLVVPDDLAGVGVEGQRRVVVEVREVGAAEQELRGGRGDRGADVDEVQGRVVARHHPRADVLPLLERHAAPGLVARLAGGRDRPPPPQLLAGHGVVGDDDAGLGSAARRAAPPRDDLAAGDDRPRALQRGMRLVVEDSRLPHLPAGGRVEGKDIAVGAGVDDAVRVDGEIAVGGRKTAGGGSFRQIAAVLPDEVAGGRVDGLDDVAGVRHVEHPAVGQRRPLLAAGPHAARPDHAQLADVIPRDPVQGAVAPPVEGPPPHQPVGRRRRLQHGVGDRDEVAGGLRASDGRGRRQGQHGGGNRGQESHGMGLVRHLGPPRIKNERRFRPPPAMVSGPGVRAADGADSGRRR